MYDSFTDFLVYLKSYASIAIIRFLFPSPPKTNLVPTCSHPAFLPQPSLTEPHAFEIHPCCCVGPFLFCFIAEPPGWGWRWVVRGRGRARPGLQKGRENSAGEIVLYFDIGYTTPCSKRNTFDCWRMTSMS